MNIWKYLFRYLIYFYHFYYDSICQIIEYYSLTAANQTSVMPIEEFYKIYEEILIDEANPTETTTQRTLKVVPKASIFARNSMRLKKSPWFPNM
jgi:hypothetical protein